MSKLSSLVRAQNNLLFKSKNVTPVYFAAKDLSSGCKQDNITPEDPVTHTGQKWHPEDYRLARFIDRPKHVNPNFAVKLIAELPPVPCKERVVWCDGGSGATGHPRVFINLDSGECEPCGYCGKRFYLENHHD